MIHLIEKFRFFFILLLFFSESWILQPVWAKARDVTPVGNWQTVSVYTGKPRSHVKLWLDKRGSLHGILIKLLTKKESDGEFCDRCKDDRKGHRIEGIEFLRGMVQTDVHDFRFWHKGRALDPKNGKEYDCLIKMEKGNDILEFRCYIGSPVFGRSEFWHRLK